MSINAWPGFISSAQGEETPPQVQPNPLQAAPDIPRLLFPHLHSPERWAEVVKTLASFPRGSIPSTGAVHHFFASVRDVWRPPKSGEPTVLKGLEYVLAAIDGTPFGDAVCRMVPSLISTLRGLPAMFPTVQDCPKLLCQFDFSDGLSLSRAVIHAILVCMIWDMFEQKPHNFPDRSFGIWFRYVDRNRCDPNSAKLQALLTYLVQYTQTSQAAVLGLSERLQCFRHERAVKLVAVPSDPPNAGTQKPFWKGIAEGSMFDSHASVIIDFANRFLGGGVLSGGCVQEEIMLTEFTEAFAWMPLCEAMSDTEVIVMTNLQRWTRGNGYGHSYCFGETLPKDWNPEPVKTIIAADAINFMWSPSKQNQYRTVNLLREMNKIGAAFEAARKVHWRGEHDDPPVVATGHWGCGAFSGLKDLKALIQLVMAKEVGVRLEYYLFGTRLNLDYMSTQYFSDPEGTTQQHYRSEDENDSSYSDLDFPEL